jgi:hypothetical protein
MENKNDIIKINYITDYDTYIKIKNLVKDIATELKTQEKYKILNEKYKDWTESEPKSNSVEYTEWYKSRPNFLDYNRIYNSYNARHLNIIYSMIRGKSYHKIENKFRENNNPSASKLKQLIKEFNLELDYFNEAFNYAR